MTREERAAGHLADAYQGEVPSSKIADAIREGKGGVVSIDIAKAAIILAIDAEAAAMRERAAKLCDERGAEEQKGFGLTRAAQNYFRARDAIRSLPATGEVGRVG